jgi:hypothetical protein
VTEDVRAALRSLATDDAAHDHAAVVAEATAALEDLHAAAAFVDDDGLARLRRAVDRADDAGDEAVADRGREALDAFRRCRRAAADHFRSGRGTVLPDGRQAPDR